MSWPNNGSGPLAKAVKALYQVESVDEFAIVERQMTEWHNHLLRPALKPRTGTRRDRRELREIRGQHLDIALFRNLKVGRGSTRLRIDDGQSMNEIRSWQELIAAAASRAGAGLEPAWELPQPAAPARVTIADEQLLRAPEDALVTLHKELQSAFVEHRRTHRQARQASAVEMREVRIVLGLERVRVRTSHDFAHDYLATLLDVDIALAIAAGAQGAVHRVRRQTRRAADFSPAAAIATAFRRVLLRAGAQPTPANRYDVLLVDDARVPTRVSVSSSREGPRGGRMDAQSLAVYGWFAPLVAQADSSWARRGLTRYQPGQPMLGDRPVKGDPLTLVSDGTLPFGLHSRPVGDLGAPTRRFSLIERGVPRGLSLDLREAAARSTGANGGIANLVLAAGTHSQEQLNVTGTRPLVRVEALDWLHVDVSSGAFAAAIGVGSLLPGSADEGRQEIPVSGGIMRGNAFDLWADARLSAGTDTAGWYYGPRWLRFGDIDIS